MPENVKLHPGRQLSAGSVGHFVELFDFLTYSFLAIYFADQFFPSSDESSLVPLLSAFGVFAIGFLIRPIAGLLIGLFADRYGRRTAMTWSIWLMGLGTALIAIAPTYAQIGVAAPMLLIFARILQGVSMGGEFTTAAAFLVESAPANRRGFFGSFLFVSSSLGKLVALGLIAGLTAILTEDQMREFGWRVPFAIGALLTLVAWWIRRKSAETLEVGSRTPGEGVQPPPGVFEAVRKYPKQSIQVAGLAVGIGGLQYFWGTYFPAYATIVTGLNPTLPMIAGFIGITVYLVVGPFIGILGDRFGTIKLLYFFGIATTISMVPLLGLLDHGFIGLVATATIGMILLAFGTSVLAVALVDLFPQRVRASGLGFPWSIAIALVGGTVSVIGTAFESSGHGVMFAYYLAALSAVTLVTTISIHRSNYKIVEVAGSPDRSRSSLPQS